jgi:hypothetical protein
MECVFLYPIKRYYIFTYFGEGADDDIRKSLLKTGIDDFNIIRDEGSIASGEEKYFSNGTLVERNRDKFNWSRPLRFSKIIPHEEDFFVVMEAKWPKALKHYFKGIPPKRYQRRRRYEW